MKIKHWQGYGCVNAKKTETIKGDPFTFTSVEVWGNHEWGIVRDDHFDIERWLRRFMPKGHKLDHYYIGPVSNININGESTEYVQYALYSKEV